MNILFCDNPLDTNQVDSDYRKEFLSATENGFNTLLFSFENLTRENDALLATRRIKHSDTLQPVIYRGWMLKPNQYGFLYNTLLAKNYQLINSPVEYQNCHYLPDSYEFINKYTPKTVWLIVEDQQVDYQKIFNAIAVFDDAPLIVKDYVKSQKHSWDTACYIPSPKNTENAKSVIGRFVELQNTDLNEGLVFREFIELNDLTIHSKSGMPLKQEYRLFFLNGELAGCYEYWEEGTYKADEQPPLAMFEEIAKNIKSNFFSMDVAKTKQGKWIIIELGDGQVAGIPENVNRDAFYKGLRRYYGS
jgi:hypothetical protein